jgi:excisionase family DNA binding protein
LNTKRLAYSVAEAAAEIGVGRTTIYELIKAGELKIVKIGSRTLVRHDDLAETLDRRAVQKAA